MGTPTFSAADSIGSSANDWNTSATAQRGHSLLAVPEGADERFGAHDHRLVIGGRLAA